MGNGDMFGNMMGLGVGLIGLKIIGDAVTDDDHHHHHHDDEEDRKKKSTKPKSKRSKKKTKSVKK
jgi:hypothetical protein